MKKMKKTVLLLAVMILSISLVFSGCGLVTKNQQADANSVVAVVKGEEIKKAEFNKMFEIFKVQYEQQYGTGVWEKEVDGRKYIDVMKEKVLDMLVDIKVQEMEAISAGITASEEEINAEVETVKKYFDSEEKFNEYITSLKMDIEYLRDTIRKDILVSKLQEKLTANVSVSDEEVASYYATNQSEFISVKASHILMTDEAEAKKVLERVKNGENINELALEFSEDPTAAQNKGDLGYFRMNEMVEPFEKAAFSLKPGEISDLVKTEYGYHIIKVEDKKLDKLEDIAAELKISMTDKQKDTSYQSLLEEMRTKAEIKKYPKNL